MLGQYSSATLIGRTLAPLVGGGAILSFFVFYPGLIPYRMVYLTAAIAAVPVVVLILLYREETPGPPLKVLPFSAFRESFVTFFTNRRLRATALVDMGGTYFAFGAFETFLPLVVLSRGMGAYQTGGILFAAQTLIIAVSKPSFGRIADRVDKRVQIVIGLLILGGFSRRHPVCTGISRVPSHKFFPRPGYVALHGCDQCVRRGRCRRRADGGASMGGVVVHHGYRAFGRPPPGHRDHCCRQRLRPPRILREFPPRGGCLRVLRPLGPGTGTTGGERIIGGL
ncbi:MFS transporter [Methanoculleus chikugoensis]|uniref:MFS transporter n=1 Tax=Methanoculleus chikugoensis TaxID=118126 RepID=UPI001FB47E8B|nr:MFS transporter [Methanoculleus chikugoensis]